MCLSVSKPHNVSCEIKSCNTSSTTEYKGMKIISVVEKGLVNSRTMSGSCDGDPVASNQTPFSDHVTLHHPYSVMPQTAGNVMHNYCIPTEQLGVCEFTRPSFSVNWKGVACETTYLVKYVNTQYCLRTRICTRLHSNNHSRYSSSKAQHCV